MATDFHTLFFMSLARCANRSVLSVSAMQALAGLMLAIMKVLELPPSESCKVAQLIRSLHACPIRYWLADRTSNDAGVAST